MEFPDWKGFDAFAKVLLALDRAKKPANVEQSTSNAELRTLRFDVGRSEFGVGSTILSVFNALSFPPSNSECAPG
jgi:hypothetical protein